MPTIRIPNRRHRAVALRDTGPLAPAVPATAPAVPRIAARGAARVAVLAALLVVGGCAAPGGRDADAPFELSEDYTDGVVSYTVQRGDRLGDIALEFTGDVSRWKEIAASNGIDDPRSLRAGAVLRIPASLIPGYADELAARTAGTRGTADAAAVPDARPALATGLAARTGPGDAEAPVELSPVDVNRRFDLAPLDETTLRVAAEADDAGPEPREAEPPVARRVMVIGSYTPKGIYAQPAVYSKLLMRVAPGTLFELDGEVGDWFGVVTPAGIGYLRDGDGRLVDDELGARTAANVLARG